MTEYQGYVVGDTAWFGDTKGHVRGFVHLGPNVLVDFLPDGQKFTGFEVRVENLSKEDPNPEELYFWQDSKYVNNEWKKGGSTPESAILAAQVVRSPGSNIIVGQGKLVHFEYYFDARDYFEDTCEDSYLGLDEPLLSYLSLSDNELQELTDRVRKVIASALRGKRNYYRIGTWEEVTL